MLGNSKDSKAFEARGLSQSLLFHLTSGHSLRTVQVFQYHGNPDEALTRKYRAGPATRQLIPHLAAWNEEAISRWHRGFACVRG